RVAARGGSGGWLRRAGRTADADVMEARADSVYRDATAAEERTRAASLAQERTSSADIVVGESCAPASVKALDQLNQETTAQGVTGRIHAVDCDAAGQISAVRLTTPSGTSDELTFPPDEADPTARIRPAFLTAEP